MSIASWDRDRWTYWQSIVPSGRDIGSAPPDILPERGDGSGVLAVGAAHWLLLPGSTGRNELHRLLADFHTALIREPAVTEIAGHEENEMGKAEPAGFAAPVEDF